MKVCRRDGSDCLPAGSKPAPVCHAINKNKLIPHADLISTFSHYLASEMPIGQKECAAAPYAGCMTAPCKETGETDDADLVAVACAGRAKNPISEIIALETAVGYSCSASQICGCTPKKAKK